MFNCNDNGQIFHMEYLRQDLIGENEAHAFGPTGSANTVLGRYSRKV